MGHFPSFAPPPDLDRLFNSLGLPWQSGSYHRTDFRVNPDMKHIDTSGLVPSYSQKALHVKHVARDDAIYLPSESSRIQSAVFPPDKIEDLTESPAVFGTVGRGKVGYLGDVNGEVETDPVVVAMCGIRNTA
jgi:hypothetical protein